MIVIEQGEEFVINGSVYCWTKSKGELTIKLVQPLVKKKCRIVLDIHSN